MTVQTFLFNFSKELNSFRGKRIAYCREMNNGKQTNKARKTMNITFMECVPDT